MTDLSDEEFPGDALTNSNYQSDVAHMMQFLRWILTPIGITPLLYHRVSKTKWIFSVLTMMTCLSSFMFVLIPSGIVILIYEEDFNMKIKLCGPISFLLTSIMKYFYLGWKGSDIRSCFACIKDDWKFVENSNHRAIMMRQVTIGRGLATACAFFLYSGGTSYHMIIPWLSGNKIYENVTIRPLTYPTFDGIFDSQASPIYEIVFGIHCLCSVTMDTIAIAACILAATFVTHACGQIQIIKARLNDLVEGNASVNLNVDQRFAVIIKDHVKVLRFSRDIEKVLREICLIELLTSAFLICLLEYYCLTEWDNGDTLMIVTYFILLISVSFNTFIYCYIGELLVNQCRNIGVVSYSIEWYQLPNKKSLGLILMIAISNYPPKITAGKIMELSLYTFGRVLKSSLVYLNLLRTVTT